MFINIKYIASLKANVDLGENLKFPYHTKFLNLFFIH